MYEIEVNKIYEETKNNYFKLMMRVVTAKPTARLTTIFKNKWELSFIKWFIKDVILDYMQTVFKKKDLQKMALYDDTPASMTIEDYRLLIQDKIIFFITQKLKDVEDYILCHIDNEFGLLYDYQYDNYNSEKAINEFLINYI